MKRSHLFFLPLLVLLMILPVSGLCADLTGKELAENVFHRDQGRNSESTAQMVLIDKNENKRIRDFISKRVLEDELERRLIRFTSPADIQGTGFLTIEKEGWETEQFLYLPALRRTRRIVTSQKSHRFVNSDFTYEDMERHPVSDYTYRITGSKTVGGIDCHSLETRPKPGTKSQYGKTFSLIGKTSFVPIFVKYFNKKDEHIKTYKVLKLEQVQDIWTEMTVRMEDFTRNHKTYIKIDQIRYNIDMDTSDISRKQLEQY